MKDDCIGYTNYYDIHMNADANANADANTDANTNADATMEDNNHLYMLCLSLLTPIIIIGIVYFILNE